MLPVSICESAVIFGVAISFKKTCVFVSICPDVCMCVCVSASILMCDAKVGAELTECLCPTTQQKAKNSTEKNIMNKTSTYLYCVVTNFVVFMIANLTLLVAPCPVFQIICRAVVPI